MTGVGLHAKLPRPLFINTCGYPQVYHSFSSFHLYYFFILLLSITTHILDVYVQFTLSRYHRTRLRVSLISTSTFT
jgi:hypothetical protein